MSALLREAERHLDLHHVRSHSVTVIKAAVARVRALYYCANPSCAGQATYAGTCCGQPMVQQ